MSRYSNHPDYPAFSAAISALSERASELGLPFDITEHDAQGCVLGLQFAICDVLTYRYETTVDLEAYEACLRWQFRPGMSRWEPREDFSEGEYVDDWEQAEREELHLHSTEVLVALGDLCEEADRLTKAIGADY